MRGTHWVTRLRSVCKWFCSVFSLNINSVVVSLRRWFNYRAWMLRPVAAPSTTYTISCLSRPTRSAARRKSSKLYAAYCSPIRSLNLLCSWWLMLDTAMSVVCIRLTWQSQWMCSTQKSWSHESLWVFPALLYLCQVFVSLHVVKR